MSGLLRLRRLRLLNFHNFADETLAVRRNVFLIGDNQSGKTTVLDAVHFALSAGVDIEFNAATRFGPRTEPGRSLASIVLRYDLERDEARRGPSVAYAILETEDGDGERCSFGAGAFATSLDSQPDVWGFIARGRSLEDLDLVIAEGGSRRRPRDRQELEEVVGRGNVFEKGRYRSALAQFLFRDRDAYLRVLEVLGAAKAYRELVARSRNLNDLFLELLPPPAETEFDEVRSALRAVEGIRGNLAELQDELRVLSRVLERLGEARQENEKETRYQLVGAELARRRAAEQKAQAERALAGAEQATHEAEQVEQELQQQADSLDTALRALRASQEFALVEREEEARRDLAVEERNRQALEQEVASAASDLERARQDADQARRNFEAARERAARAVRSLSDAVRDHLDETALLALEALAEGIALAEAGVAQPYGQLQQAFHERRDRALEAAARAETQAASLREQAGRSDAAADQVRNRAEVLPDLAGYEELLLRLETGGFRALPLYRLIELAPGIPESLGAAIECVLGPRTLGAIVTPEEEHGAVRAEVLAHGAGVEVLDPAELRARQSPERDTLPAALAPAELTEAAALAQAYLRRVAGDVRILPAGTAREGNERVVWTDGYIYELGAESRVEAGAPRFLGAEARRRAAAAEEQRLRVEARYRADAAAASEEALAQREVARICSVCLDELRACSPDTLLRVAGERNHAAGAAAEREESVGRARTRLASAAERCRQRKLRHEQIAAAIAGKGLLDLRSRLERLVRNWTPPGRGCAKPATNACAASRPPRPAPGIWKTRSGRSKQRSSKPARGARLCFP